MKIQKLPLLMLLAALAACGDEMGTEPQSLLSPDAASYARGGRSEREAKEPRVKGRNKRGQEKEFKVGRRRGAASDQMASAWITPEGGVVRLGNHTLTVPAGAVDKSTRFSIKEADQRVGEEMVFALDLKATTGRGRSETDVGAAGFNVPVELCVDAATVEGLAPSDEFVLIWLRGQNQVLEVVDAGARGAQVCGDLDHFSLWALGWP